MYVSVLNITKLGTQVDFAAFLESSKLEICASFQCISNKKIFGQRPIAKVERSLAFFLHCCFAFPLAGCQTVIFRNSAKGAAKRGTWNFRRPFRSSGKDTS